VLSSIRATDSTRFILNASPKKNTHRVHVATAGAGVYSSDCLILLEDCLNRVGGCWILFKSSNSGNGLVSTPNIFTCRKLTEASDINNPESPDNQGILTVPRTQSLLTTRSSGRANRAGHICTDYNLNPVDLRLPYGVHVGSEASNEK